LKLFLSEQGIDTKIHYPIPIHLQEAAKFTGYKKGDFPIAEKQTERIKKINIIGNEGTDEDKKEALIISMENCHGDCLIHFDEIVSDENGQSLKKSQLTENAPKKWFKEQYYNNIS